MCFYWVHMSFFKKRWLFVLHWFLNHPFVGECISSSASWHNSCGWHLLNVQCWADSYIMFFLVWLRVSWESYQVQTVMLLVEGSAGLYSDKVTSDSFNLYIFLSMYLLYIFILFLCLVQYFLKNIESSGLKLLCWQPYF